MSEIDQRIDFIISPEVQLERVIKRSNLVTRLTAMSALQRYRAEDSHFYWQFTNLAESYDLTNFITGVGILAATRPNLRFQVLGGARVFIGIPLHWDYRMENSLEEGIDLLTRQPVDPQDYPSRIIIRNGLRLLTGWQISMGAQYEIARRLFIRSLFSFGNSQQYLNPQTLQLGTLPRGEIKGLGNSLTLGLVYDW
ncbi:MAG: hypothetical protein AAGJ82_04145 [Bacteroidota bacterium]